MLSRLMVLGSCLQLLACGARGAPSDPPGPNTEAAILGAEITEESVAWSSNSAVAEAQGATKSGNDTWAEPNGELGNSDLADGELDDSEQPEWSVFKNGAELVDANGSCAVFVDVLGSPLAASDISVVSGGVALLFSPDCAQAGFRLLTRETGLYVALCDAACQLFRDDPSRLLEVHSNYALSRNRPAPK